jgi:hypothetical protein
LKSFIFFTSSAKKPVNPSLHGFVSRVTRFGQILAKWANVNFWQFLYVPLLQELPKYILDYFFTRKYNLLLMTNIGLGHILGDFFHQAHPVALFVTPVPVPDPQFGAIANFLRQQICTTDTVRVRVARWFVFRPKIQIWVNFGGPCNGR